MSPADPKDGTLVVAVCHSPDHDTGPHLHGNLGWFAPADPVSASLEPRTEAGKALKRTVGFAHDIRDIEDQSAAYVRRDLLVALETIPTFNVLIKGGTGGLALPFNAVRRLIEDSHV